MGYEQATGERAPKHVYIPWRWFVWGDGFTLGPIIFVRPDCPEVYVHELVHVRQFWSQPLTFHARYLWRLWKYGYHDNPYEVEAYATQRLLMEEEKNDTR